MPLNRSDDDKTASFQNTVIDGIVKKGPALAGL